MTHPSDKPIERKQSQLSAYILTYFTYAAISLVVWSLYVHYDTEPAFVFAPQGISLAAFILLGYAAAPAVALASLTASIIHGFPWFIIGSHVISSVALPATALLALRALGFRPSFERVRDFGFFAIVAVLVAAIVPSISVLSRALYSMYFEPIQAISWLHLYVGSLVSMVILTPLVTCWAARWPHMPKKRWVEPLLLIFLLNAMVYTYSVFPIFDKTGPFLTTLFLLPCFIVILLIALRHGMHFTTLAVATTSVLVLLLSITAMNSETSVLSLDERLLILEITLIAFSFFLYILASIEESRKRAVATLEEYSRSLRRSLDARELDAEAKNQFISMLGHEIRNPLAAILSSVEILRNSTYTEQERARLLKGIETRVHSMGRLLDDIFDISRITRNKIVLKPEVLRAQKCLRSAADSVEYYIRKNKHHFDVSLPGTSVLLKADPVRIDQILTNLLLNAIKYTPQGGHIALTGTYEPDWLTIQVRDSGVGLTKDQQVRIFEPFMQINPRQSLMGGVGLGLTLAKNLTELHGGSIAVRSDGLGRGSVFTVRLPAYLGSTRQASLDLPQAKQAMPVQAPAGKEAATNPAVSVLVVDDNEEAAGAMSRLLRAHGVSAQTAFNGADALKKAPLKARDAVLLDIGLPDMDGFEVAKRLREKKNPAILIALSGFGQPEHKHAAKLAGFDHYLTKPVSVTQILELIRDKRRKADT